MDAQEDSFKATIHFGQSLISSGHFASDEIKEKVLLKRNTKSFGKISSTYYILELYSWYP